MNIKVDPNWWKTMFDEIYLITDARSVCNDEITISEVDVICELLPIRPEHRILDLCGGHGRHSFELYARGFKGCTLVDYSQYLIDYAKTFAEEHHWPITIVRSDARKTGLPSESFNHVLIMGNSMGYIQECDADRQVLIEAHRLLCLGGWLLVDVLDGRAIKDSFSPTAWHETKDNHVICRKREIQGDVLYAREVVLSKEKGLLRDQTYAIRFYEPQTLATLFEQTGFTKVNVQTNFSPHEKKGDYGFMNHRMIATGRK